MLRKIISSVVLIILIAFKIQAQIINIPDLNFKNALLNYSPVIDTNHDGEIESGEALAVTSLSISNLNIRDLTGIKDFTNLQMLICDGDKVAAFDVSDMIHLKDVEDNAASTNDGSLFSVDVSGCINLTTLSIERQRTTNLDVSNCINLQSLDISSDIQLTSLDLSTLISLARLDCGASGILNLDLSHNPVLTYLDCHNIGAFSSPGNLTNLDVSNNTNLQSLFCQSNQLASLNLSKNINLVQIDCSINALSTFDIANCTQLQSVACGSNQLTSLPLPLDSVLYTLTCAKNQLTSLDISKEKLGIVDCSSNNIRSLLLPSTNPNDNPHLSLNCSYNQLSNINLLNTPNIQGISCTNNLLTALILPTNINGPNFINCDNNKISSLDLSNAIHLSTITCSNNQLTALNLSKNHTLGNVDCSNNQITGTLDISNSYVGNVNCSNNKLTSLLLKNGNIYSVSYSFGNNPNLNFICADSFRFQLINDSIIVDGMKNVLVTSNCSTVVPLSLLKFTATLKNNIPFLDWQSANETNTSYFIVERSFENNQFHNIGKVDATGFSSAIQNYRFVDSSTSGQTGNLVYYRLKMVDNDGVFTYSNIATIDLGNSSIFDVYPNPTTGFITIAFGAVQTGSTIFNFYTAGGQLVKTNYAENVATKGIDISKLTMGVYYLQVVTQDKVYNKKITVY